MNSYARVLNNPARSRSTSMLSVLILSLIAVALLGGCVKIPRGISRTIIGGTFYQPPTTSDTWLSSNLTLQQENKIVKATLSKKVVRQTTQISEHRVSIKEKAIFVGLFPGLLSATCNFDGKKHDTGLYFVMPIVVNFLLVGIPNVASIIVEPFSEYGPGQDFISEGVLIGLYKNTKTSDKTTETVPEILSSEEMSLPCPNETVTLTAPMLGKQFNAKTDKAGVAVFDLLQIAPAGQNVDIIVRAPKVNIPPDEVHMKVSVPETE